MTTTTLPYRDDAEGVRIRYEDLLAGLGGERSAAVNAARVAGRRSARVAAGIAGILGVVFMVCVAAAEFALGQRPKGELPGLLLWTWAAMGAVYVLAWGLGARETRSLAAPPRRSADPRADLARLEAERPLSRLRARAAERERASLALPLIAISLLAPLTIHLSVWACAGTLQGLGHGAIESFDTWMRMSMLIVGHAHLVLAFLGYRFARRAVALSTAELAAARSGASWRAYGYTVLASALPGALFLLIPPVLTAVTGLLFNPIAYRLVTAAVIEERRLLGAERAHG